MNKINPAKLLNSKWTAVKPTNKEKHFLVTEIEFDENNVCYACKTVEKKRAPSSENYSAYLENWKKS